MAAFRTSARHAADADRRRQRPAERRLRLLLLRADTDHGVRQLRRQHHLRAGGPREHRPQRRSAADRPATRRPVPCRSRPEHGRRPRLCERRRRPVHRDLVRRAGLRVDAHDQCAADASARRLDRNEVRDGDACPRRSSACLPAAQASSLRSTSARTVRLLAVVAPSGSGSPSSPSSTPSRWRASSISRIPTTTTSW